MVRQVFAMEPVLQNPLLSTQKSSDGLQVALHPLVLLTISDYITRHTLRNQKGPVVGALLGQQNGREITIEHAFDCLLVNIDDEVRLHKVWFEERLQQSKQILVFFLFTGILTCICISVKDVHKVPALDLVGWYTILPTSGPQPAQLPIHRQILDSYNESAILLGFHSQTVLEGSVGGKLPLTIYESNYEADEAGAVDSSGDKEMKDGEPQLGLKFKELPYSVETGEAEMISVDFVARGGGNATAVEISKQPKQETTTAKGKARAASKHAKDEENDDSNTEDQHILSREDEELIASLTAKANAIKMLHTRINLIATYLRNLPPSYTSGDENKNVETDSKYTPVNYLVLRSIQALLVRLSLLVPADSVAFSQELVSEQNDVNLVSLLSLITASIKDVREVGKKFAVIDSSKVTKGKISDQGMGRPGWDLPALGAGNGAGDLLT